MLLTGLALFACLSHERRGQKRRAALTTILNLFLCTS